MGGLGCGRPGRDERDIGIGGYGVGGGAARGDPIGNTASGDAPRHSPVPPVLPRHPLPPTSRSLNRPPRPQRPTPMLTGRGGTDVAGGPPAGTATPSGVRGGAPDRPRGEPARTAGCRRPPPGAYRQLPPVQNAVFFRSGCAPPVTASYRQLPPTTASAYRRRPGVPPLAASHRQSPPVTNLSTRLLAPRPSGP